MLHESFRIGVGAGRLRRIGGAAHGCVDGARVKTVDPNVTDFP